MHLKLSLCLGPGFIFALVQVLFLPNSWIRYDTYPDPKLVKGVRRPWPCRACWLISWSGGSPWPESCTRPTFTPIRHNHIKAKDTFVPVHLWQDKNTTRHGQFFRNILQTIKKDYHRFWTYARSNFIKLLNFSGF